tara:strand:+ start:3682 stop:3927 length:246 start_codon:yes stop_codon:yes gene_type:complete
MRKRTHALMANQFFDGPTKYLGGTWFAKKHETDVKIYTKVSVNKYDEVNKDCFELTMQRSKQFPTKKIKENLRRFCEQKIN